MYPEWIASARVCGRTLFLVITLIDLLPPVSAQTVLYNTYSNTVGACLSACRAAAQKVCQRNLSSPTETTGRSPVIDHNVTVGACGARFFNWNQNATKPANSRGCLESFHYLLNETASPSNTSSCSSRIGGLLGNNAYGRATEDAVYAYFLLDSPSDGFKSSLDGVPPDGYIHNASTIFDVDQSSCQDKQLEIGSSSVMSTVSMVKRFDCGKGKLVTITSSQLLCLASLWVADW